MVMLTEAAMKVGINDYGELVEEVLGKPMGIFLNIVFIEYLFGAAIIYLLVIPEALG